MKRATTSRTDDRKKKKYRSDGTGIWEKPHIDGPGVWVSCIKGKEAKTVKEVLDLFDSLASEMWPIAENHLEQDDSEVDEQDVSIEDQIANEVSAMKRPKAEKRFVSCQTNTPCVIFIGCKPPVDPVKLVVRFIEDVERTGVSRTRFTHRFVPVSGTCVANLPEISSLCNTVFDSFFSKQPEDAKFTYKIELRIRNHTTLQRQTLIEHIAKSVPPIHTVALENPTVFILVEVFKSVCGVSVVRDYYRFSKFNVMEISRAKNINDESGERGRVSRSTGPLTTVPQ